MRIRITKDNHLFGATGAIEAGTEFDIDADELPAAFAGAAVIVSKGKAKEAEPATNPAVTQPTATPTKEPAAPVTPAIPTPAPAPAKAADDKSTDAGKATK